MTDSKSHEGHALEQPEEKKPYALVVNKGTAYDGIPAPERKRLASRRTPADAHYWAEVEAAHQIHQATLKSVTAALDERGWRYEVVRRTEFFGPRGHDLVVTVGGDGTVLNASHSTIGVPLLGVNSDPQRSVGYFCATDASGIGKVLAAFEDNQLERFRLDRLRIEINGETVGPPVLNDVLVANENPAATSRYILIAGAREERQKSSGLWISTPAGSTAGIRSAGGAVLPLNVPLLQYLVREPVVSPLASYELLRGVRALEEGIVVVSQMEQGFAYVDGPYEKIPLPLGARMRVCGHEPLYLLGLEPSRRER